MTLIRSEHNHEKAVQSASDQLGAAERELEDARSSLERLERLQYHEEQIWSDNIRRNSTWVTIGLMGANIFILLVTVVIIEPWRRKRLVIEIKRELERRIAADGKPHASAASLLPVAEDSLAGRDRSDTELSTELSEARPGLENGSTTVDPALQGLDEDKVHEDKVHESSQMSRDMLLQTDGAATLATVLSEDTPLWRNALNCFNAVVADPLGQREVSLTNLGVTSTAITGVAVGAITTSLALVLLRGR